MPRATAFADSGQGGQLLCETAPDLIMPGPFGVLGSYPEPDLCKNRPESWVKGGIIRKLTETATAIRPASSRASRIERKANGAGARGSYSARARGEKWPARAMKSGIWNM